VVQVGQAGLGQLGRVKVAQGGQLKGLSQQGGVQRKNLRPAP